MPSFEIESKLPERNVDSIFQYDYKSCVLLYHEDDSVQNIAQLYNTWYKLEMNISLDAIIQFLKSLNLEFNISGNNVDIEKILAIGPDVKKAVCYYEGKDPDAIRGVEKSIVVCKPILKQHIRRNNAYIFTEHPQMVFYHITSLFDPKNHFEIHPKAIVHQSASIGNNVSIGPFSVLENCCIGDNVIIDSGVRIHQGTQIGNNVRIEANTVIGATGMMWAWDEQGDKIHCLQTGHVLIGNDVYIGTNVTIVRGSFENRPTVIGGKSMIGHCTSIAHGCVIGLNNHLASNVALAGSVKIGDNCFLSSAVSIRPNISIPDDTTIGIGAVVVKNFTEKGLTLFGNPAEKLKLKTYKGKLSGIPARYS